MSFGSIFKTCKNLSDGSRSFPGTRLFHFLDFGPRKYICSKSILYFSIQVEQFGGSRINHNGFTSPRNHETEDFSIFGKWTFQSTSEISMWAYYVWSLWHYFFKIHLSTRFPSPLDPKSIIFRILYRIQKGLYRIQSCGIKAKQKYLQSLSTNDFFGVLGGRVGPA